MYHLVCGWTFSIKEAHFIIILLFSYRCRVHFLDQWMPFHGVKLSLQLDDFHVCINCILTLLLCLLNEHLPPMLKWLVMQATMWGVACRAWPKTYEAEKLPQFFILRTGLDGAMTSHYVNCWSIFLFLCFPCMALSVEPVVHCTLHHLTMKGRVAIWINLLLTFGLWFSTGNFAFKPQRRKE